MSEIKIYRLKFKDIVQRIFCGCLLAMIICLSFNVQAQEKWEKEGEGEIRDVEVEIIKDRKITLPKASRNFEKVPPRPYEPIKPAITYELKNFKFATPDYKPTIRPLKLKGEELSKIYGNYVSVGVGNYGGFFLEGSATTKRDKNKYFGAHVYSMSFGKGPVDDKNSASSNTQIQLFGKSMGKDVTFSADANYDNRGTYFYGYNYFGTSPAEINRDKIRQDYAIYSVNAGIENTKPGDFNYTLKAGYSYLEDHYRAKEGEFTLTFNSAYKINETSQFIIDADYFLINRTDSLVSSSSRHLLRIKPSYQFKPIEKLTMTTGVNIAVQNDQYAGSKDLHLYPHIKAQYELSPSFEAYGIVTGDMDKVDLHSLSAENLWVNSNINIAHTNRSLEFKGGMNGKIGRKVAVSAGVSLAALKNYYFYVPQTTVQASGPIGSGANVTKFEVTYDGNTRRINPFAEISYAQDERFRVVLRGDYFSYSTETLTEAFQRPTYRVGINSRYNLFDKISLEAGLIAQGGMKSAIILPNGLTYTGGATTLDAALDLNFKARYFLSKEFSAFLQFNNILGNNYPLYLNYPARGFQVLGGVSWSF